MTLTTMLNKAPAGAMAHGKQQVFTHTNTTDVYEVIDTVAIGGMLGVTNTLIVTGHDLLFKFEYTRDGINWTTSITDFPVAAAATGMLTAVRSMVYYRVSCKNAVAGQNGSVTWVLTTTDMVVPPEYRAAFAYESLTITNAAAVPLTLATFDGAFCANISVEDNPIRVRWDGTDPTTTEGHILQSGDTMHLDFTADIWHFRAIATGGNAKLRVTYSK